MSYCAEPSIVDPPNPKIEIIFVKAAPDKSLTVITLPVSIVEGSGKFIEDKPAIFTKTTSSVESNVVGEVVISRTLLLRGVGVARLEEFKVLTSKVRRSKRSVRLPQPTSP
ncbi:MAG: hypothetical protein OQJ93_11410 [Ignavibacteriaceae bacterium]|nr:hypothetical protein [Ignavibacteriaceae bacterium]